MELEKIVQLALQIGEGAIDVAAISTRDIVVEEDLANLCREPLCAFYGLSANCPPNVPGPAEFRDLLKNYEHGLVIKMEVPAGCLNTGERLIIMRLLHEIVAQIEKAAIGMGYPNSKAFAAGSCKEIFCDEHERCSVLTENKECRNPEHARPTIEAVGINVSELNKSAGWSVIHDSDKGEKAALGTVYGLVLLG